MTLTHDRRHKPLRPVLIPSSQKELARERVHYRGCKYLRWPMPPELVSLLLILLSWRASRLIVALQEPNNYAARITAINSVNVVLRMIDRGLIGIDPEVYGDWVQTLSDEVKVMRSVARGDSGQSLPQPGPALVESGLESKVRDLLRQAGFDLAPPSTGQR